MVRFGECCRVRPLETDATAAWRPRTKTPVSALGMVTLGAVFLSEMLSFYGSCGRPPVVSYHSVQLLRIWRRLGRIPRVLVGAVGGRIPPGDGVLMVADAYTAFVGVAGSLEDMRSARWRDVGCRSTDVLRLVLATRRWEETGPAVRECWRQFACRHLPRKHRLNVCRAGSPDEVGVRWSDLCVPVDWKRTVGDQGIAVIDKRFVLSATRVWSRPDGTLFAVRTVRYGRTWKEEYDDAGTLVRRSRRGPMTLLVEDGYVVRAPDGTVAFGETPQAAYRALGRRMRRAAKMLLAV